MSPTSISASSDPVSRSAAGSSAPSRRASVEQSFEDSLASLTPALQLLMEDPAGVLPREMAIFRHHVVVYRDTIQPLDTSEWLSVIRCAVAATEADRYRRADAALIDERAAVVLRTLVGSKALAPPDATPQEKERILQQADKTNDDLVRRWRQGDREATARLQKLLAGVITVPEIMARTLSVVMESHLALTSLASRAEASINRSLRDIHWRRNLMRLADNSGFGQTRDTGGRSYLLSPQDLAAVDEIRSRR